MDKFQDFYRIPSIRLQNWDYGWNASYFVTICTANKECYFGEIRDVEMILSLPGIIAEKYWSEIPQHFPYVLLDAFVIMPNHVHGIVIITDKPFAHPDEFENIVNNKNFVDNETVETRHALSLQSMQSGQPSEPRQPTKTIGQKRFQHQGENTLSSIIGSYKSFVTRHLHRPGFNFAWQSRFYEHIIRDSETYHRIRKYILNNPKNWNNDEFFK